MKKLVFVLMVVTLMLAFTSSTVLADKPTELDSKGNGTNFVGTGFDVWGYNYPAHLFSGYYCDSYQNAEWCQPYKNDYLIMKWNDAWLSSRDLNGDGLRDRHFGFESYIGSGAWLTNHQTGTYVGADGMEYKWTYFVKIVAKAAADYDCAANGGYEIWGEFCVIEEIYNDAGVGAHGVMIKASPAGLGAQ